MHAPKVSHLKVAFRVLRYLKCYPSKGMHFKCSSDLSIRTYYNFDWAFCSITRKSVIGFCIFVGSNMVSYKSKKQSTIFKSSAEAEYRAMAQTYCVIVWIVGILSNLKVVGFGPTDLYCNDKATIHIAANHIFHDRTKQIEIDCHLIKNYLSNGIISTKFTTFDTQLANVFTRTLSSPKLLNMSFNIEFID